MKGSFDVHSVEETWALARQLAAELKPGDVVCLEGDLGAGKTTFTQGLAAALGVGGRVTSPTFCIVQEHTTSRPQPSTSNLPPPTLLVHMDLYRLKDESDVLAIGWEDYLARGAIFVIEWPDRAGSLIPPTARHLVFRHLEGEENRLILVDTFDRFEVKYTTQMARSLSRFVRLPIAGLAVGFVLCALCGCLHDIKRLFVDPDPVDSSVVARWWDGPKICPGVKLDIQVGTQGLNPVQTAVLVDQNGDITLQHLLEKPVHCDGMTLEELKKTLLKEYSAYYRQPQITVTFAPYDGHGVSPWGTVTVLGEVGNPGPVNMPSTMDLTITKVLQAAGGVKQFADRTRIQVTRCERNGKQQRTIVDLNEIGKDGRADLDMRLRAGDVVWVPETWY